jgi:hypothetical protein
MAPQRGDTGDDDADDWATDGTEWGEYTRARLPHPSKVGLSRQIRSATIDERPSLRRDVTASGASRCGRRSVRR